MVMKLGETRNDFPESGARDAHHVAAALASSSETLSPGDSVYFIDHRTVAKASWNRRHGVLDPFLAVTVPPGMIFWVLVDPKHVTEIRHAFEIAGVSAPVVGVDDDLPDDDDDSDSWCRDANC